jgi:hypothetical protein
MRIMVTRNWHMHGSDPVETYSSSVVRVLREKGHEVVDIPKGPANYDGIDLILDVDCGRNAKGELIWQAQDGPLPVPSAVMLIDSHGYPSLHKRLAPNYDHVFFAVWDKRGLFTKHPSAHWCPNFTDLKWFNGAEYPEPEDGYPTDFGFFGSKGGLSRAEKMTEIAAKNNWTAEARQINVGAKHRWPQTAEAMANCRNLFNCQQKHDGPNLRVMESMLMNRPLIADVDPRSGMTKLFTPGEHFVPYHAYSNEGLEEGMRWMMDNRETAKEIASSAYIEVREKHLVENRIDQMLEVVSDG